MTPWNQAIAIMSLVKITFAIKTMLVSRVVAWGVWVQGTLPVLVYRASRRRRKEMARKEMAPPYLLLST